MEHTKNVGVFLVGAKKFFGVCYSTGKGVDKDEQKAVELWKQSAEMGIEAAIIKLSEMEHS